MSPSDPDPALDAALRAGREVVVPGFADRAVAAVRRDRARLRAVRLAAFAAPLAACLALALPLLPAGGAEAELERLAAAAGALEVGVPSLEDSEALALFVAGE